jgi:tRNA(Ile)-lysidine synthase
LVRLADQAGDEEAAWESVVPRLLGPLDVRDVEGGVSFDRGALLELHPTVRARVVRALARALGNTLGHAATRRVIAFSVQGSSGRAIQLGGSLSFAIELDRCVLGRALEATEDQALAIEDGGPGRGWVVLSGSSIPVAWGGDEARRRRVSEHFAMSALRFPLTVRSRRPGDRIRLPGGTRKVKKVLLEDRIPPSERHRVPLVVDAEGEVLWIPGVARAEPRAEEASSPGLRIGIG